MRTNVLLALQALGAYLVLATSTPTNFEALAAKDDKFRCGESCRPGHICLRMPSGHAVCVHVSMVTWNRCVMEGQDPTTVSSNWVTCASNHICVKEADNRYAQYCVEKARWEVYDADRDGDKHGQVSSKTAKAYRDWIAANPNLLPLAMGGDGA
jgi:hypothetical protein